MNNNSDVIDSVRNNFDEYLKNFGIVSPF